MEIVKLLLNGIPEIAGHPLAFCAYVFVILAWVITTLQRNRLKEVLSRLADVPDNQRKSVIETALGVKLPATIDGETWLRSRKQKFLLFGFLATLFVSIVYGYFAFQFGKEADLKIDDVRIPKLSNMLVSTAYANDIPKTRAELVNWGVDLDDVVFAFDVSLRNPSEKVVSVNDVRVTFDKEICGGIAGITEISGVYVTRVENDDSAKTKTPDGTSYEAYAWYPNGQGCLIVKTPLTLSLQPNEVDRFRVVVSFPKDYDFLGPMNTAKISVLWNKSEYVDFKTVSVAENRN